MMMEVVKMSDKTVQKKEYQGTIFFPIGEKNDA